MRLANIFVALACLGSLAGLGCGPDPIYEPAPARIMVAISTDAPIPAAFDLLLVKAARANSTYEESFDPSLLPNTIRFECAYQGYQGCDHEVDLTVSGRKGSTDVKITRSTRLDFVEQTTKFVRLPLCTSCTEVSCAYDETCKVGRCVDYEVDSESLPNDSASLPIDDGECAISTCSGDCTFCGTCPNAPTTTVAGYAIDNHEVTRAQYAAFLASNPSVHGQQEGCLNNTRLDPETQCAPVCEDDQCDQLPQTCVDWCDAAAYCK